MSSDDLSASRPRIPVWTLILDVLGTLALAAGLYGQFASGELLFADFVDLRANAVALIVVGVLLIVPAMVAMVLMLRR